MGNRDEPKTKPSAAERARCYREATDSLRPLILAEHDRAQASAVSIVMAISRGKIPHLRWDFEPDD